MVDKIRVIFGGWYQRTTLHLSEVQRFLLHATSDLELSKSKLKTLRENLELKSVKRIVGELEYLEFENKNGVNVKYFEDGLYVLSKKSGEIDKTKKEIKDYFNDKLQPALHYLFSLGAPTPKILSNMKDNHPFLIERITANPLKSKVDKKFGNVYLETKSNSIKVSKTPDNIIIDVSESKRKIAESLTEMQIFFSDFKLQLHKYLDIHRKIWEDIDEIKERKTIRGKDIGRSKAMLNSYEKTVQLIDNRIDQMSNYARTRRDISRKINIDRTLNDLFQYRFEDLFNTLEYIKEVWEMTTDYVRSSIRVIGEAEKELGSKDLDSIRLLVGFGVISGIIGYFEKPKMPEFALTGVLYVVGLGAIALFANWLIKTVGKQKSYELNFVERDANI